jgi:hypothetical protein
MSSFLEKRASREGREGREGQGQLPCKRSLEEKTISEKCLLEKENEIQKISPQPMTNRKRRVRVLGLHQTQKKSKIDQPPAAVPPPAVDAHHTDQEAETDHYESAFEFDDDAAEGCFARASVSMSFVKSQGQ